MSADATRPRWLFQREQVKRPRARRPFGVPVQRPSNDDDRVKAYDNSKHTALIVELVNKGATVRGFGERVADAITGKCGRNPCTDAACIAMSGPHCECDRCFLREQMLGLRVIPDAHAIDAETKTVTAYEVEVTHRVSEYKHWVYQQWWFFLDEFYWRLRLVIVDRFGNEHAVSLDVPGLHPDEVHVTP